MKKTNLLLINISLVFVIFLIGFIFASNSTSYCCEKTTDGAWCQNAQEEECMTASQGYRSVSASCEATSYCKMGCCYNTKEGTCTENSPERTCEEDGGVWSDSATCEIGQCTLGCCLIGDQAAFVTQTRCKRLANLYGLDIDFRTDITDEFTCIASITSDVEGACIYEKDYQAECVFTTQKNCVDLDETNVTFHAGLLCSNEKLGTTCAPTEKTTCVEGKDQVYFVDSCGNVANVYDSTKINNQDYWGQVYDVSESCSYGESNAGSSSCGNCDYFLGSTCKDYKRIEDRVSPSYGDYICKDLSCEYEGKTYQHGETWCANQQNGDEVDYTSDKANSPGSRYFRLMCYNKEVIVEPCADYRAEICVQDEVNGFSSAACVVNKWQDCFLQIEEEDCENGDRRDCKWISGITLGVNSSEEGTCVPKYAPGFDFWNSDGEVSQICATGTTSCNVEYETDLFGNKKCVSGCECLEEDWENDLSLVCTSLGDCGNKINFAGQAGYKQKEYVTSKDVEEEDDDE
jgi:hypothetical protein